MRASTGFHHHGAGMKRSKEFDELLARYLLAKNHPVSPVLPMQAK
jgi:hypothetical protein